MNSFSVTTICEWTDLCLYVELFAPNENLCKSRNETYLLINKSLFCYIFAGPS